MSVSYKVIKSLVPNINHNKLTPIEIGAIDRLLRLMSNNPYESIIIIGGNTIGVSNNSHNNQLLEVSKIHLMRQLLEQGVRTFAIGGQIANTFLQVKEKATGSAIIASDELQYAASIQKLANEKGANIILPRDYTTIHKNDLEKALQQEPVAVLNERSISPDRIQLDIGNKARQQFLTLAEQQRYRLWHGSLGITDNQQFTGGSQALAHGFRRIKTGFSLIFGQKTQTAICSQLANNTTNTTIITNSNAALTYIFDKLDQ